jgi:hypothetical protein
LRRSSQRSSVCAFRDFLRFLDNLLDYCFGQITQGVCNTLAPFV